MSCVAKFFGLPEQEQVCHVLTSFAIGKEYAALGVKKGPIAVDWACSKHFWRGLIDGDGSVVITSKNYPYLTLCGTQEDMETYSEFCLSTLGFKPRVYPGKNVYLCSLGGDKVKHMCRLLYKDQYSALQYKRLKAESIYSQDINPRSKWRPPVPLSA